jgi:hypothetical protein
MKPDFIIQKSDVRRIMFRELLHFYEREGNDLVGYKVLVWTGLYWRSPAFTGLWVNYRLTADSRPTTRNQGGIYVAKRLEYIAEYLSVPGAKMFIVGIKPRIVEEERGYRAQKAYMIQEVVV